MKNNNIGNLIKKIIYFIEGVVIFLIATITVILTLSAEWMFQTWPNLNMDELVYQLNAPIEGTNLAMVEEYIQIVCPTSILVMLIIVVVLLCARNKHIYHRIGFGIFVFSSLILSVLVGYVSERLDVRNYSENKSSYSTFIDTNYVNPEDVSITFPEKKRNLIYIYLESVEATYSDKDNGGAFDINYIPELTNIAQENEDFSGDNKKLNGGYVMPSATWTVAAMFAQSTGLPLKIPVGANSMDKQETFLPRVVAIGDILEKAGYNQTLLIGSDATFGGRRQLYTDHGAYDIKDYSYAINEGWIPADYRVWWGYEDVKLFDYAKKELLELSSKEEPFNLTLLTVDTHFEDGYYCSECQDLHSGDNYANVLSCSSKQVSEFLKWIQQQSFYENTTIVISGDHLTMDSDFCIEVDKNKEYTRKVYTSYINSDVKAQKADIRREYTTFDNFPTTLASLGVLIEGNRLGLGTNLFSDEFTLTELYGIQRMESEIRKESKLMEELASDLTREKNINEENPIATLTVGEYDYTVGYLPLYISNIDDKKRGITGINVAVWVNEDQSDIQWMQATKQDDGNYTMNIDIPNFSYKTGEYKMDVYLIDGSGEQILLGNAKGYVQ